MRLLVALACAAAVSCIPEAKAQSTAVVGIEVARAAPAVGPGFVDSFAIVCLSASPVAIAPPSGMAMLSYECINESTTMVAVGDNDIPDPGTTREGPVYCATGGSCPAATKAFFGGNVSGEFCRGDTDTTIRCRAMVAGTAGP